MLSVVDFARDILNDYKVIEPSSAYGAVLFKASDGAILLLHRGLVRFGDHENQLTGNENLECCNLEGWFIPPTTEDDQLAIGISICKNRQTVGDLNDFWEGAIETYSVEGYEAKMLQNEFNNSNSINDGFRYCLRYLTVWGHGRDNGAIKKIEYKLKDRIKIVKNNVLKALQSLDKQRQERRKTLRSMKKDIGLSSGGGECTAETEAKIQQLRGYKFSLPYEKMGIRIETAILEQLQTITECSVGRIYYTDPDLNQVEVIRAVLILMQEVINSSAHLCFCKLLLTAFNGDFLTQNEENTPEKSQQRQAINSFLQELGFNQYLSTDQASSLANECLKMFNLLESYLSQEVSVGNQSLWEIVMFFKEMFKRDYENAQLEWDILLPAQPFKDFHGKILWIFSCQTQLVQLLSYLYFVQNKDTVRSFLNELLEMDIPYILVEQHKKTPKTNLLKIYSEKLDKLFQQSEQENKERLTYKLLNVHLLGCRTIGFSKQNKSVNIMRRHWLKSKGTVSSYQWTGTPEQDDPYYRHDDTHVPMYLLEP